MTLKESLEYILNRIYAGELDADWKLAEAVMKVKDFMKFLWW